MYKIIFFAVLCIYLIKIMVVDLRRATKYGKKLTPTMKFIIAAGANTYKQSKCTPVDVGGSPTNKSDARAIKHILRHSWSVNSSEDLRETIHWLFYEGHNEECMEIMEKYIVDPKSVKMKKFTKSGKEKSKENLEAIIKNYKEQGIMAWDLCRVCNVAGWGFVAGYITYEEAIKYSVDACRMLQEHFTSWDDMMENYFLGLAYWSGEYTMVRNRRGWYSQDKNDVYNVDWNTQLDYNDVIPARIK